MSNRSALVAAAALLALTGCTGSLEEPSPAGVTLEPVPTETVTVTATTTIEPSAIAAGLADLPVASEHETGYDRAAFGPAWRVDTDHNGCTAQQDVLARDLTGVTRRGRCTVLSGDLIDPYTGERVHYARGGAAEVDIDHVVALAEAWRSGAWVWTDEQRANYASDPHNLLATVSSVNRTKGDQDGAWTDHGRTLPIGAERRCSYALIVVMVKGRYELSIDVRERGELASMLGDCQR